MFYVLIAVGITLCGLHAVFLPAKVKTNIGQFVMRLSFISLASCTGLAAMSYFNVLKDKWHLIVAPAVISLGYWTWKLLLQPQQQPGSTDDQ